MKRIGKKLEGVVYTKRPGAYAIIEHKEDNKVAIARANNDCFFLGGGIEEKEMPIEALKRELLEEAGYTIKNVQLFDEVTSWTDGERRGPLEVIATFYIAEFDQKVTDPIEKDHEILWVDAMEYKEKLYHEYQRYILGEYAKLKEKDTSY